MKSIKTTIAIFTSAMIIAGCGGSSSKSSSETIPLNAAAAKKTQDYVTVNKQVGASVALVKGTRLVWAGAAGDANKALGIKATTDTVFMCASVSKPIMTAAVMTLVERGKINLDADVNDYLPFKIENPKSTASVITMRRLLSHTSGLSDLHFASFFAARTFYYNGSDPTITLADFVKGFFTKTGTYYNANSFRSEGAGGAYEYSNMGYTLAGYVVERVTGKSLADYAKDAIFGPLGMTKSSYRLRGFANSELAMPYGTDGSPLTHYTFADWPGGSVRTTALDLSRFMRMLINNGTFNGRTVLARSSVDEMKKVQNPTLYEGAGLGLDYQNYGTDIVGHLGQESGVGAVFYFEPSSQAGAIVLLNTELSPQADVLIPYASELFAIARTD